MLFIREWCYKTFAECSKIIKYKLRSIFSKLEFICWEMFDNTIPVTCLFQLKKVPEWHPHITQRHRHSCDKFIRILRLDRDLFDSGTPVFRTSRFWSKETGDSPTRTASKSGQKYVRILKHIVELFFIRGHSISGLLRNPDCFDIWTLDIRTFGCPDIE